jgi:formimidoylglutamate deiminase
MVDIATRFDKTMPIHMHASEQTGEVAECLETHGVTPLEWASDLVSVDPRWCFIHSTHLTSIEMRKLVGTGASIGLCPMTEANLGDGIFDFVPWFEARAPWGIGGDSHVSVSPFEELRALEYSQRLRMRVRVVASEESAPDVAANLWSGAAAGGARAVGQPVGAIATGLRADLVVLDGADLDFEGLAAPARLGVAMFSGNSNRVRDVYVGGRIVVEEGHHGSEDEARDAFRRSLRRLRSAQ